MIKQYNIRIFGQVQGVGFRYLGKTEADKLNITGLIRNEPDGSVFIEAEGARAELNKFIAWCKVGPSLAVVTKIEVTEGTPGGYTSFKISS